MCLMPSEAKSKTTMETGWPAKEVAAWLSKGEAITGLPSRRTSGLEHEKQALPITSWHQHGSQLLIVICFIIIVFLYFISIMFSNVLLVYLTLRNIWKPPYKDSHINPHIKRVIHIMEIHHLFVNLTDKSSWPMKNAAPSQVWWHIPLIPALLGRLRQQEQPKFDANLVYTTISWSIKTISWFVKATKWDTIFKKAWCGSICL